MNTDRKQFGARIVRGSAWTGARQAVQQASSLIQLVVVARLLPPEEVGLFAMAMLVLTITRAMTETGFEQALIQRTELDDATLDVGFTIVLLRAALVATIVASGAPLFAGFFSEPRVAGLLRVLAGSMLIEGLINNRVAMLQRNLDFRRYFFFQASGQLVGLATTIVSASLLHNVWAVVFGQVAGTLTRAGASYVLADGSRPRLRLQWSVALELVRYGRWVGASSILLFLLVQGDNLFIGKIVGATELAYYAWGYQLANLPALFVTQILASVMFPALSAMRGQPERLRELLLRSMRLTLLLTLPAASLIAALCEPFTLALLGQRWLPIVPIARALCGFGVMRALGASAGALFLAVGRPDLRAKIQVGQLVVLAATIYPLYLRFGVTGVAWAVTLYGLLSAYAAYLSLRLCGLPLRSLQKPALRIAISTAFGAAAALLSAQSLRDHALLSLLCGSFAGALAVVAVLFWLDQRGDGSLRDELRSALTALRKSQT